MRSPPSVATGLFAGRYAIEREIGQGASAIVYLARDTRSGTAVALKILRPELAESRASDRFLREIKRTSALQHPHILPVLDAGDHEGQLYFALPYMEGGTLRHLLKREKHLELSQVIAISKTIAEALDYAHERGLIHRDVKPENILFTNGVACLGDFGIARAIDLSGSGGTGTTSRNVVRGTAAYMSPEQAAGSQDLDGRSDVFSLACVIYEMIAGMQAYIGPTDETVIAQRFIHPPRDLRVYRSSVSQSLDDAVQKAFAIVPADRYRSAGQLVQSISDAAALPSGSASDGGGVQFTSRVRRRSILAVTVAATILAAALAAWASTNDLDVDPDLFAVLPFAHSDSLAQSVIDGPTAATLAYDALRRWRDIRRIDPLRVADALDRSGARIKTLAEALDLARTIRAGRLLWGEIHHRDDRTVLRGVLYEVTDPDRPPREASVTMPSAGAQNVAELFALLVDSLVANGQPRPAAGSIHPFAAVTAYTGGVAALNRWELREALEHFNRSILLEPTYPAANLRYAQVAQWLRRPAQEWRQAALAAAGGKAELDSADRFHAEALVSLANADYPGACARFADITRVDSMNVAAWFGLGDCQREDRLVLADSASPSGWRFRSSRHAAGKAYLRAFELVPTSYRAYRDMLGVRLESVFITRAGLFREGSTAGPAQRVFGAFPELIADTIAFVPYLFSEFTSGKHRAHAEAIEAGMKYARDQLHALAERWVQATPQNATAWETRAVVLERAGILRGHPDRSALGSVARARKLTTSDQAALRLAVTQVRLLLKTEQFKAARTLADSLVNHNQEPTSAMAVSLASLSGLIGNWDAMDRLVERAAPSEAFATLDGRVLDLDVAETTLALRLMTGALAERPIQVLQDHERQIEQRLATIPDTTHRRITREVLLRNFAMFAYPSYGPQSIHGSRDGAYLISLQASAARGDSAKVHNELLSLADRRRNAGIGPGVLSVDAAFLEASLLAQLGDTTAAIDRLDDVLQNLTAQRDWFRDLHSPAFLVKSMVLRAELAKARGDARTMDKWTSAVSNLRRY